MKVKEYFSYNLKLDLDDANPCVVDKKPAGLFAVGMFFSLLLVLFGGIELISAAPDGHIFLDMEQSKEMSFAMSPIFFDLVIIVIGLFAFVNLFISIFKYRKIEVNKRVVNLYYKNAFGHQRTTIEKVENYLGVLLRVEFVQIGFVARNRYIVELVHKDYKKNIPLYISTNSKDFRKIWMEYAKKLKLPCIDATEDGLEFFAVKDLDKSLISQVKAGVVVDDFDIYERLPSIIQYARRKDKIILKAKKFWFDIFNMFLSVLVVLMCVVTIALKIYVLTALILLISSFLFAKKDKLVIKKHKLVKVDKYGFFNKKVTEILKKDIKSVEIEYNPSTDRNYIAVYSDDNVIIFAKKMPVNDLKWVKKFLINQITRN